MSLFLDSVDLEQIESAMDLGIFSGVTTNPKLLAEVPSEMRLDRLGKIARICRGSLYLQVDLEEPKRMERQALTLREVAPGRTIIKVPLNAHGLVVCTNLRNQNLPVCLTAAFSPLQAFSAASAGAHAVALYTGRITRTGGDGVQAVSQAAELLRANGLGTRVLAASVADADTLQALLAIPGIDVTIPAGLIEALLEHPGTQEAIEEFRASTPE